MCCYRLSVDQRENTLPLRGFRYKENLHPITYSSLLSSQGVHKQERGQGEASEILFLGVGLKEGCSSCHEKSAKPHLHSSPPFFL